MQSGNELLGVPSGASALAEGCAGILNVPGAIAEGLTALCLSLCNNKALQFQQPRR